MNQDEDTARLMREDRDLLLARLESIHSYAMRQQIANPESASTWGELAHFARKGTT